MCTNVICLCTKYVCLCVCVCVCVVCVCVVCVCVWCVCGVVCVCVCGVCVVCVWCVCRDMVSITLQFINSEELFFSESADEALLPKRNASVWVKTSSVMVVILCTKSESFHSDSLFNYACQLPSP